MVTFMTVDTVPWHPPPLDLELGLRDVHVWREILDVPTERIRQLELTLAHDERSRAAEFRFEKDRSRYIAARGLLREILSEYVQLPPNRLRFQLNSYGRPCLGNESGGVALCFNMCRSNSVALYAIALKRRIGVDIERMDPDLSASLMAEQVLSPRELTSFLTLPLEKRQEALFTCWTRKEAYLKASGHTPPLDLRQIEVGLSPRRRPSVMLLGEDQSEICFGSLEDVKPGPGYVGAVAAEAFDWQLTCMQFCRNT